MSRKTKSIALPGLSIVMQLSERCILMSQAHGRSLLAKVTQRNSYIGEIKLQNPVGPVAADANGNVTVPVQGILTKYPIPFEGYDEFYGLCPAQTIIMQINAAVADATCKQIILSIDTPGGFVNGSVEAADCIQAAAQVKPVIAHIHGLCCSGGYYLASQCTQIYARRESEVGNIGVYTVLTDVSKFYEDIGVELTLVTSGPNKGLGADGKVTEAVIAEHQRIIDGLYEQFCDAVASGREMTDSQVAAIADGKCFLGPEALQLNLIDGLASSFDDVLTLTAAWSAEGLNMAKATQPGAAKVAQDETKTDDKSVETKEGENKEPPKEETKATETVATAQASAASSEVTAENYIATFGDVGARWFLEKKPFAVAAGEFIGQIKAAHKIELDAVKAENQTLKTELAGVDRGNPAASHSASVEGDKPVADKTKSGYQQYASLVKLPGKTK